MKDKKQKKEKFWRFQKRFSNQIPKWKTKTRNHKQKIKTFGHDSL